MNLEMMAEPDVGKVRSGARSRILMWDPAVVFEEREMLRGAGVKAGSDRDFASPTT